jgi:hypothetical protein
VSVNFGFYNSRFHNKGKEHAANLFISSKHFTRAFFILDGGNLELRQTIDITIGPSNKYLFRVGVGDILILLTV